MQLLSIYKILLRVRKIQILFAVWLLYDLGIYRVISCCFQSGCCYGTLLLIGKALGWAPKDVYTCGDSGLIRLEIRSPSLIAGPLGYHHCSDCFVPVTVTYRDAITDLTVAQSGADCGYGTRAQRASDRRVSWGTNIPQRVVIQFPESCDRLFS